MPSLPSLPIADFLAQLGAKTPAPGGGAVASLTGALAASLARMVVAYSLNKKSLADHQPALERAATILARTSDLLLQLADEDAAAYALVNELSRLPESDPRRKAEWPAAVEASIGVPRAVLGAACDLLRLLESLQPITNQQLRSDLAIAAILAESAAKSAWWNVKMNLTLLPDPKAQGTIEHESQAMLGDAAVRRASIEQACA
jgi:formiminotetrahydrofolate cyclodeaminase